MKCSQSDLQYHTYAPQYRQGGFAVASRKASGTMLPRHAMRW